MRILLTVDPEIPVPPIHYGGIERIVDGLIYEYAKNGHEVFLLANKESTNQSVSLLEGWKGASSLAYKDVLTNANQLLKFVQKHKPDIVHSFSRLLYLYPLFIKTNVPVLQSYQREISAKSTSAASWAGGTKLHFSACAGYMYKHLPTLAKWSTVYNFTDTDYYTKDDSVKPEYLAFLGRIEDIKGTKEAIEAAKLANVKLVIAGNIPEGKEEYFDLHVKPHLQNGKIEYIGPVDNQQKKALLQGAKGFLFPILWEEPFGIVMAESLACGAPVIGFRRGSVPEVVEDGVSGFIVNDIKGMVEAIGKLDTLDRTKVRDSAVQNFSQQAIAKEYLKLYGQVINEAK